MSVTMTVLENVKKTHCKGSKNRGVEDRTNYSMRFWVLSAAWCLSVVENRVPSPSVVLRGFGLFGDEGVAFLFQKARLPCFD